MSLVVDRSVRLRDEEILFAIRGQIIDLSRYTTFFDLAIWCFDKTELVDPRKGRSSS